MNNLEVMKRWRELRVGRNGSIEQLAKKIIKEFELSESVDEVLEIAMAYTPEETKALIEKENLCCDRCNTNEHLVVVPIIYDEFKNRYSNKFEVYCNNKVNDSTVFSKCWNHVYAYKNGIHNPHKEKITCMA